MDTEEQQRTDQLAAYALGALDADEMAFVEQTLKRTPGAQEELQQFRDAVALLPFAVAPATPPERVRTALFDRIAAETEPVVAPMPTPTTITARPTRRRWIMPSMLVTLLVVVLSLAGLTLTLQQQMVALEQTNRDLITTLSQVQQALSDTQVRQQQLAGQLQSNQEQLAALSSELAFERAVVSFVTAPGVATRTLNATAHNLEARGEMYMYPGHEQAVVVFSGLHTLEAGKTYQFWLTDGQMHIAGGTFLVDETGITQLVIDAPREVNAFTEVFLTVEPSGGSNQPGDLIILTGSL